MNVETSEAEEFIIEIQADREVAVAIHIDGEEKIFLPEKKETSGTYYHESTDSLVETPQGYQLKVETEPENFEIIC